MLLVIAGEGPARASLERTVCKRKLANNVRFVGYLERRTELPGCYCAADAFVLASKTEARGLVLLEAMALGAARKRYAAGWSATRMQGEILQLYEALPAPDPATQGYAVCEMP